MLSPSFLCMIALTIGVMLAGRRSGDPRRGRATVLAAALLQTAVTFADFLTMEIPAP